MKYNKTQVLMMWFLPLIVIGGLFFPMLGYLVVAMMAFFLTLSFFKGRYWCGHLCPRGAFLDIAMSKFSPAKPLPKFFTSSRFRWGLVAAFMCFISILLWRTGGNILAIGGVFVSMCLITTIISIILGLVAHHRGWCAICPMGTLQGGIGSLRDKKK
ncbi:4Fe-4S binding protein [Candidatus Omnitrophota bacterium]